MGNLNAGINTTRSSETLVAADGLALAANNYRKGGLIQNLGTAKLYVRFGAAATTSLFRAILAPGGATDDGYGGSLPLNGWKGSVYVYTGATTRCMVSEDA